MKVKTVCLTIVVIFYLAFSSSACISTKVIRSESSLTDRETIFQVSTLQALLAGAFDGEKTFDELRKHGDFGVGMINGLDGEMIALNGDFYQVKENGQASPVSDLQKTPFAIVTFFNADDVLSIENGPIKFASLRKISSTLITDKNAFYAIKIEGEFQALRTRSIPAQVKPYRRILEVFKSDQQIQDFKKVKGTLVGFWFPVYSGGINVSSYHFHFISKNGKRGGHVLDFSLLKGKIEIDLKANIQIELLTK
jgi:acetolactate decarboxylase